MKICRVCGWRQAKRRGRCSACYQFWRRTGQDKTPEQVMRAYERVVDAVVRIMNRPEDVPRSA